MLLEMAANGHGDRIALGARAEPMTYRDLAHAAWAGAALIEHLGVGSVAFVGVNSPVLATLIFATAAAGVPFSPLNYRLPDERIVALADRLDRPLLVADAAVAARLDLNGAPVLTTEEWLAVVGDPDAPTTEVFADGADIAIILFTSGTTGEPKAVLLRHGHLVSYILGTVEFGSATDDDAVLVSVPPYHVAGVVSTLSSIYAGRRIVHLPNFDAASWVELVERERITSAMVVPTMLARIVELIEPGDGRLASLRELAYGGAPIAESVLVQALERMPDVDFTNAYGLTETSSTITLLGPEEHRAAVASSDPELRARLRSAGRAIPVIELQVRDERGRACAPHEIGELWVRGTQVSGQYARAGSALDADGWFPTRDLAHLDEDGFLYLHGRSDDTIIRGGENISPVEIENVLRALHGVLDVCVVGVPDDEWGQRTIAVIQADPAVALDEDRIRTFARARLRGSLTPDAVVISERRLPYSPVGKLLRREVASGLARGLELHREKM